MCVPGDKYDMIQSLPVSQSATHSLQMSFRCLAFPFLPFFLLQVLPIILFLFVFTRSAKRGGRSRNRMSLYYQSPWKLIQSDKQRISLRESFRHKERRRRRGEKSHIQFNMQRDEISKLHKEMCRRRSRVK